MRSVLYWFLLILRLKVTTDSENHYKYKIEQNANKVGFGPRRSQAAGDAEAGLARRGLRLPPLGGQLGQRGRRGHEGGLLGAAADLLRLLVEPDAGRRHGHHLVAGGGGAGGLDLAHPHAGAQPRDGHHLGGHLLYRRHREDVDMFSMGSMVTVCEDFWGWLHLEVRLYTEAGGSSSSAPLRGRSTFMRKARLHSSAHGAAPGPGHAEINDQSGKTPSIRGSVQNACYSTTQAPNWLLLRLIFTMLCM